MKLHKLRSYIVVELGVWLPRNGVNEKQEQKFNAHGCVFSKNASTFASWYGCIVRKRTTAPLMVKDWKGIPKEPIDYQQKMLQLVSVSRILINNICAYMSRTLFILFP